MALKNLMKMKTVKAMIRKSIKASISAPYSTATSSTPSEAFRRIYFLSDICTPSVITDNGGIITCFTMVFTTLLKAVPIMIPTAISSILPFIANSLNSFKKEVFGLLTLFFVLIRQMLTLQIIWFGNRHLLFWTSYQFPPLLLPPLLLVAQAVLKRLSLTPYLLSTDFLRFVFFLSRYTPLSLFLCFSSSFFFVLLFLLPL